MRFLRRGFLMLGVRTELEHKPNKDLSAPFHPRKLALKMYFARQLKSDTAFDTILSF
jgi:hypothetical protein